MLYGWAGGGLSAAGGQQFWQGAGEVAGIAEDFDAFGWALVGSDQPTGPTAASSSSQAKTPDGAPSWTADPTARPVDPDPLLLRALNSQRPNSVYAELALSATRPQRMMLSHQALFGSSSAVQRLEDGDDLAEGLPSPLTCHNRCLAPGRTRTGSLLF